VSRVAEVEIAALGTEEVKDLVGLNRYTSIPFENEANETNLLEESLMCMKKEGQ
jgi:hypothetical protein